MWVNACLYYVDILARRQFEEHYVTSPSRKRDYNSQTPRRTLGLPGPTDRRPYLIRFCLLATTRSARFSTRTVFIFSSRSATFKGSSTTNDSGISNSNRLSCVVNDESRIVSDTFDDDDFVFRRSCQSSGQHERQLLCLPCRPARSSAATRTGRTCQVYNTMQYYSHARICVV